MLLRKNYLLGIVWGVTLMRCQQEHGTVAQQQDTLHSDPKITERVDTLERKIAQKTQLIVEVKKELNQIYRSLQTIPKRHTYSNKSEKDYIIPTLRSKAENNRQCTSPHSTVTDMSEEILDDGVGMRQEDAKTLEELLVFPSKGSLDEIGVNVVPTTAKLKAMPRDDSLTPVQTYVKQVEHTLDDSLAEMTKVDNNQAPTTAQLEEVLSDDMNPYTQTKTSLEGIAQRLSALIEQLNQDLNVLEEKKQQQPLHNKN